MPALLLSLFSLLLLALLPPASAPGPGTGPVVEIEAGAEPDTLVYREVDGERLRAYVFMPEGEEVGDTLRSAVLLFHGGGYWTGSPALVFRAAQTFASHGMAAVAVQYRLSDEETTPIEALDDACAAFSWARAHAGALRVDPSRVAGYGVSAGGHLVAAAATIGCPDDGPDLLLLWSPALDVAENAKFEGQLQGRATAAAYSPVEHVGRTAPPTSIVHGRADAIEPIGGSERYCERLVAAGGACDLTAFDGLGHLLSRNLDAQIPGPGFDPDPTAAAAGVAAHLAFLRARGFLDAE